MMFRREKRIGKIPSLEHRRAWDQVLGMGRECGLSWCVGMLLRSKTCLHNIACILQV